MIRCRSLVVGYGGRAILPPLELTIGQGELWVVVGHNGSGKTTWLRTLLGLLPPVSGSVEADCELRSCYLSQRQTFDPHYPVTVEDVVRMGVLNQAIVSRGEPGASARVSRALAVTCTADLAKQSFHRLSEGQKQRVLLARVHAAEANLAVLDEPTSAMDQAAEREAWEALRRLQLDSRLALVVVTHALGLAAKYADHALVFERESRSARIEVPERLVASAGTAVGIG